MELSDSGGLLGGRWLSVEPSASAAAVSELTANFLLPNEGVVAQVYNVVLVNSGEDGMLLVTNFRLAFLAAGAALAPAPLADIPLTVIDRVTKSISSKTALALARGYRGSFGEPGQPGARLMHVATKDLRHIVLAFKPHTKQRRLIFDTLQRVGKPSRLQELYAFAGSAAQSGVDGGHKFGMENAFDRLRKEYERILRQADHQRPPSSNPRWRISDANSNYTLCMSYPSQLLVPACINDADLHSAATFRGRGRLPVITWAHPNGAVLSRSAQPLVGLMMNSRSEADEALVASLWRTADATPPSDGNATGFREPGSQSVLSGPSAGTPPRQGSFSGVLESSPRRPPKKLYIVDARPRKNAFANGAMGGGSEGANYAHCEVVFMGIENIHTMRDSFNRLALYIDSYGQGTGFDTSRPPPLLDPNWLTHASMLLSGAAWVAGKLQEGCSVLVHCSDGWDRTTQLVALAQLLLDGHYRTFDGFRDLVEKDWLAMGHPFSERMGLPDASAAGTQHGTLTLGSSMWERRPGEAGAQEARRSPAAAAASAAAAAAAAAVSLQASPAGSHNNAANQAPIFLQFIDCVATLLRLYPRAFEFSAAFLVDLLDCVGAGRFGDFVCNSEWERVLLGTHQLPSCWDYLAEKRATAKGQAARNPFASDWYAGPLSPSPASLVPTLWARYFLRWQDQGRPNPGRGQQAALDPVEGLATQFDVALLNSKKARKEAEARAHALGARVQDLEANLREETARRRQAETAGRRAQREVKAMRQVIATMGCHCRLSRETFGTTSWEESEQGDANEYGAGSSYHVVRDETASGLNVEPLSVSVTALEDSSDEGSCTGSHRSQFFSSWGHSSNCSWRAAQGSCSRAGSDFAGLKVDYDAFKLVPIVPAYFGRNSSIGSMDHG